LHATPERFRPRTAIKIFERFQEIFLLTRSNFKAVTNQLTLGRIILNIKNLAKFVS
jgi:hypothetical protein